MVFGDQPYWKEADRRGTHYHPLTEHQKRINQSGSRTRCTESTRSEWSSGESAISRA